MTSRETTDRPASRRVLAAATGLTFVVLAPTLLAAQTSNDSASVAGKAAPSAFSGTNASPIADAPISLCVVPGSGTAYRVGSPGLPTQCLSASHTLLSLNMTGPQGAQGVQGVQGITGLKGEIGAVGPKGDTGAAGVAGPQGVAGVAGALGPIGPVGATGAAGVNGTAGDAGANGAPGIAGAAGAPGAQGAPGAPGAPGAAGAAGTTNHAALTNLTADSHTQYLRADGTRALSGALSAGGFKLTGLALATSASDALRFDQAVKNGDAPTGDLGGTFPNPVVRGLYGRAVSETQPTLNQVLAWNGSAWAPAAAATASAHATLSGLTADDHPQYLLAGNRLALDGFTVRGTIGQGAAVPSGAGTRLVWNPQRGAFRAGTVEGIGAGVWNEVDIGYNSAAFGLNNKASGNNSFAAGYRSSAEGVESFAIGIEAVAGGQASMALGGRAYGYGALAVGNGAYASGHVSIALGQQANASASNATAIGPSSATGIRSVAIGSYSEASGEQSIVIGNNASTGGFRGSIVIGASFSDMMENSPKLLATAQNQLMMRAAGGTTLYSNDDMTTGVTLAPGGGSWSTLSDRNRKTSFRDVNGESLLLQLRAVPVTSWTYKAQDQSVRHIGPMAQDWERTFGLSRDSTTINSGDIAGVTLAGVQALEARTAGTAGRIVTLEERVRDLEHQLQELMQAMRLSGAADAAGRVPR